MNTVDLGLIGLFFAGIFYGYRKGFISLAIGLAGLVISLLVAYSFSQDTAVMLQEQFPLPSESSNPLLQALLNMSSLHHFAYAGLAFILLFFLSRVLCKVFGKVLQSFAELPLISVLNRSLGALLGLAQTLIVMIVAVHLISAAPGQGWKETFFRSAITQYILEMSPILSEQIRNLPKQKESPDML